VLADLAKRPLPGWDVHLVTPYRRQIYSGMLPGWIAGHYPIEHCAIALDALAARAAVALHETAGIGLDPVRNVIRCADGTNLHFDHLSIDTGPMPGIDHLPGSVEHALPIRPIERFIGAWPQLVKRIQGHNDRFNLVILGGGAAGVELAFAIHRRAKTERWSHLHMAVVGLEALPMDGTPDAIRRRAMALLLRRGLDWRGERRALRIEPRRIVFEQSKPLDFDACLVSTGAAAPAWPLASGLATDQRGFIRVGPTLQSVSHSHIFAAGDVASYHDARPKSGVYAVKAGPVLADNLRAVCEGRSLRRWSPQRRALYLISTGEHHALASWGRWSWGGNWVWHWKDWIDRRFMRRFGTVA
jgi:pyridine nucleotide-disulfide oxidoreductase family protein